MNYVKTFELYKTTYQSAAGKLRKKQPNLSKRFMKHADDHGLTKFRHDFMKDYKFDIC